MSQFFVFYWGFVYVRWKKDLRVDDIFDEDGVVDVCHTK